MKLKTGGYVAQAEAWPQSGRYILAQFDAESVVVYQAYNRAIGERAAQNGYFGGGGFRFERMSWIKTNFLWMMYRSGWGTKENQEVTLAIHLRWSAFNALVAQAVHSTFVPEVYGTQEAWREAVERSDVRLQWDPDHAPNGEKQERRAIQLGLRGDALAAFARDWIVAIEDISDFVREQRSRAVQPYIDLRTPLEAVVPVTNPETRARLGLSPTKELP